jgi:hypothetical protein
MVIHPSGVVVEIVGIEEFSRGVWSILITNRLFLSGVTRRGRNAVTNSRAAFLISSGFLWHS